MPASIFTNAPIPETIQQAIAPVFLLTGIGAFMNVIAGRLARVVDRARLLEPLVEDVEHRDRTRLIAELQTLEKRMTLASRAIYLCTASGLSVCILVMMMFVEELIRVNFSRYVAAVFIFAVMLLASGMVLFLRETRIAVAALHVKQELIDLGAKPTD
jgi:hypothetical protein